MILGFSTSSAWASVAAIDPSGEVLWQGSEFAPQTVGGACLKLLKSMKVETGLTLEDATLFASDIGPGSFTGVRVGVTLAKTFGYLFGCPVAGASSFDLISADAVAVLPSKKGEFFIRQPGLSAVRSSELPTGELVGYGPGIDPQTPPAAFRFAFLIDRLLPVDGMAFVPEYLIEPSISIPKKPFASRTGSSG